MKIRPLTTAPFTLARQNTSTTLLLLGNHWGDSRPVCLLRKYFRFFFRKGSQEARFKFRSEVQEGNWLETLSCFSKRTRNYTLTTPRPKRPTSRLQRTVTLFGAPQQRCWATTGGKIRLHFRGKHSLFNCFDVRILLVMDSEFRSVDAKDLLIKLCCTEIDTTAATDRYHRGSIELWWISWGYRSCQSGLYGWEEDTTLESWRRGSDTRGLLPSSSPLVNANWLGSGKWLRPLAEQNQDPSVESGRERAKVFPIETVFRESTSVVTVLFSEIRAEPQPPVDGKLNVTRVDLMMGTEVSVG